jgi:hypothetical protein
VGSGFLRQAGIVLGAPAKKNRRVFRRSFEGLVCSVARDCFSSHLTGREPKVRKEEARDVHGNSNVARDSDVRFA